MSYLGFHAAFIAPVILILAFVQPRPMGGIGAKRASGWIVALALIAFIYTTAWDNYLVYRGVWSYGSDRVIATIGYVPIEEYLFFLLQPILTGLWYMIVRSRSLDSPSNVPPAFLITLIGFWLLLAIWGAFMLSHNPTLYMGLILVWAGPVLAGMAWLSAPTFWQHRREWAFAVGVPTVYLWVADRIAIGLGIWDIADAYSLGFDPFGLPIEEAVFFLVTNLMVVQGLMMLLPERRNTLVLQ